MQLTGKTKLYDDCDGCVSDFLDEGDYVDDAFFDFFLGVMPPACWKTNLLQMGEPMDHRGRGGRPRFLTLQISPDGWVYTGCHVRGETVSLQAKE